jgi:hypothetical protein
MIAQGWLRPLTLALLLCAASCVRTTQLEQPLLSFHPTRQFRSAIIARACYYDRTPAVPEWARLVARANRAMQPAGEPTLMEALACAAYSWMGRESLAAARMFAIVFWLLGTVPLYFLARRFSTFNAAMVGTATYLFLPYGIVASRAFQPDPLMTSCTLWAMLATTRHVERPGASRLLTAAVAIAAAGLVKPMSVFLTLPAGLGLAMANGRRRAVFRRSTWMPLVLGLALPAAYYGYDAVFGTLARDQMNLRFVPALLPTSFFWGGWWRMIQRVWGLPIFFASLIGTAVAHLTGRYLLVALWLGYIAFAIAFTYHMPTHDYYHLPYIALAALAVSALFTAIERWLVQRGRHAMADVVALASAFGVAIWGSLSALPRLSAGDPAIIARYERIGELAEHHTRVLFLDSEYGYPLMYHGQVSGDSWPSSDDLAAEALGGEPRLTAHERYARDFADYDARYFIVTDLRSLRDQPDLQNFLTQAATIVRQEPELHVYRLHPGLILDPRSFPPP